MNEDGSQLPIFSECSSGKKKQTGTFGMLWRWDKKHDSVIAGAVAVFVTVLAGTWGIVAQQSAAARAGDAVFVPEEPQKEMPKTQHPFIGLQEKADSAALVLYDVVQDKFLFAYNGDEALPLASVTKLMTALVAHETVPEEEVVTIQVDAIDTEGDSGLRVGEQWKLQDLIGFTLLTSSNDGAEALAASVGGVWQLQEEVNVPDYEKVDTFVDRMNMRARELNLDTMRFQNPSGLDIFHGSEGGVGSAKDVAKLLAYMLTHSPEVLAYTQNKNMVFVSETGVVHVGQNTNEYVGDTYGILGSKTGYTDLAGGNLAVVFDAGLAHPVVAVSLGSTREGRFSDVKLLERALYEYVESGWYEFDIR